MQCSLCKVRETWEDNRECDSCIDLRGDVESDRLDAEVGYCDEAGERPE